MNFKILLTAIVFLTASCIDKTEYQSRDIIGGYEYSLPDLLKNRVYPDSTLKAPEGSRGTFEAPLNLLLERLYSREALDPESYNTLSSFLLDGRAYEHESEALGYLCYEHFKRNRNANISFAQHLQNSSINQTEVYSQLIKIMCIDLMDDSLSYKDFQEDFIMFKNRPKLESIYNRCIKQE